MIRKSLAIIGLVVLCGCTYGQDYIDNPESFIRDPHFAAYKDKRDALESSYLNKKITYAEYIERRDQLDNQYDKEVQHRNDVIQSGD